MKNNSKNILNNLIENLERLTKKKIESLLKTARWLLHLAELQNQRKPNIKQNV